MRGCRTWCGPGHLGAVDRPGTLASRGFGPADLAALRPGVVDVELSAWGFEGPWKTNRGYDTVVQSATGMAAISGSVAAPRHMPVSALDYVGGNLMAFGAMVALARRATVGGAGTCGCRWRGCSGGSRASVCWMRRRWPGCRRRCRLRSRTPMRRRQTLRRGHLRYLGPVVRMGETAPWILRPAVPLGTHAAAWPEAA